jgi:hypothetical protein
VGVLEIVGKVRGYVEKIQYLSDSLPADLIPKAVYVSHI